MQSKGSINKINTGLWEGRMLHVMLLIFKVADDIWILLNYLIHLYMSSLMRKFEQL